MMRASMEKPRSKVASRASKARTASAVGDSRADSNIRFSATLSRPMATAKVAWTFLTLPRQASAKLPSRGMTSVEGTLNGLAFRATLDPDGQGGDWLKVGRKLREAAGAEAGDVVSLEIRPLAEEPEPRVPADLRKALAAAHPKARAAWSDITPAARRDWIQSRHRFALGGRCWYSSLSGITRPPATISAPAAHFASPPASRQLHSGQRPGVARLS
jgi:hypothetical protein